jgi:hypothetical protein
MMRSMLSLLVAVAMVGLVGCGVPEGSTPTPSREALNPTARGQGFQKSFVGEDLDLSKQRHDVAPGDTVVEAASILAPEVIPAARVQ